MRRLLCLLVCLALLSSFAACGVPSTTGPDPALSASEPEPAPDPDYYPLPDTRGINPLTGEERPATLAEDARPVAVMVANNVAALPQRGVAAADVVYEMLTEGGITRLMAVYADRQAMPDVGPVRSTRPGFVQLAAASDSILVSIGSSIYAGSLLGSMGYRTLNGIYLGTTSFYYDTERGKARNNEYCWYTSSDLVWSGMEQIDLVAQGQVPALFIFGEVPGGSAAYRIGVEYSGVSRAGFVYDEGSGLYAKTIADDLPHTDEDGAQLAFSNVFLLQVDTGLMPDGISADFDMTGGIGYYFARGGMVQITWRKAGPEGGLRVYGPDGAPLTVQPGKSYVGFVQNTLAGVTWAGE